MSARLLLTALLLSSTAVAADWPRFRGPNGTGVVEGTVPTQFDLNADVAWKAKLPGVGHGSPIVVGDKVFLQAAAADGSTRTVLCLSAKDGSEGWAYTTSGKTAKTHKKNNLGSPTPCSDGERVYAAEWDGSQVNLTALNMKGEKVWRRPLGEFHNEHGFGHSPVVYGGTVFFNFDHQDSAELLAFDAKTGEPKWTAKRKGHRASYATPFVREAGGRAELVVATTTSIDGYDPATGKANWSHPVAWENPAKKLRAIAQPVLAGGQVVMATGDGDGSRYMLAVRPDGPTAAKAWELKKNLPYVPGPLVSGDHLYWVGDDGKAGCADVKTGEVKWSGEQVLPKGVSSSPLLVGSTILAFGEDGTAVAFDASPKGPGVGKKSNLGEPVFATPAAADGKLYVRGGTHLYCIRKKGA